MESKEIKDLRRDHVTRKAKIATVEITAVTEQGVLQWAEIVRENYLDHAQLRQRLKARLVKEDKLLTNMRIIKETVGLYGMSEDEFFANAKLLKEFSI